MTDRWVFQTTNQVLAETGCSYCELYAKQLSSLHEEYLIRSAPRVFSAAETVPLMDAGVRVFRAFFNCVCPGRFHDVGIVLSLVALLSGLEEEYAFLLLVRLYRDYGVFNEELEGERLQWLSDVLRDFIPKLIYSPHPTEFDSALATMNYAGIITCTFFLYSHMDHDRKISLSLRVWDSVMWRGRGYIVCVLLAYLKITKCLEMDFEGQARCLIRAHLDPGKQEEDLFETAAYLPVCVPLTVLFVILGPS